MMQAAQAAAVNAPPIFVDRDQEGLHLALVALFEESLLRHRVASALRNADDETCARIEADMPPREISPGYFLRAGYLLQLSTAVEIGVPLDPGSFTHADMVGLEAVRTARAQFERDHPPCPACGERQDNRYLTQCFKCQYKFGGKR